MELAAGGFVEGTNLQVDRRGFGQTDLDTMATELMHARPEVIFAFATPAAHAAKRATRSIPIVAMADDLVTSGLVSSMAHPEGNVTGVTIFAFELDLKRLECCTRRCPMQSVSAYLPNQTKNRRPDALDRAARDLGIEIVLFTAKSNEEIARCDRCHEGKID